MNVQTLKYSESTGFSAPIAHLDSRRTLVLVFASPEFDTNVARKKKSKRRWTRCRPAAIRSGSIPRATCVRKMARRAASCTTRP
jgi:hypothetical protein